MPGTNSTWSHPGARWWKFDVHTHTPSSDDYGKRPNQASLKRIEPGIGPLASCGQRWTPLPRRITTRENGLIASGARCASWTVDRPLTYGRCICFRASRLRRVVECTSWRCATSTRRRLTSRNCSERSIAGAIGARVTGRRLLPSASWRRSAPLAGPRFPPDRYPSNRNSRRNQKPNSTETWRWTAAAACTRRCPW